MSDSLFLKSPPTLEKLREHRDDILRLAAQHGATNMRVFGSVARGEATLSSDVDLLVTWDYEHVSAWGGVGLDLALESLLGVSVDIISEQGLSPWLRDDILKEAVPL